MRIAERKLLPAVRAAPDALLVADGFSCREQLRQATGRQPLHLAEVLQSALAVPATASPKSRAPVPPARLSPWALGLAAAAALLLGHHLLLRHA